MSHTRAYVGCSTNIRICIELQLVLFLYANWTPVGTPGLVSVIIIIIIIIFIIIIIIIIIVILPSRVVTSTM